MKNKDPFPFSEEDLEKAAVLAGDTLAASLSQEIEATHTFSDSFLKKMEKLMKREKVRRFRQKAFRTVAAVFAVILMMCSVWFATEPDAWAKFQRWLRHAFSTETIYEFFGGNPSEPLPEYELTWLPEGYTFSFALEEEPGMAKRNAYQGPDNDVLYFTYNYMTDGKKATVDGQPDYEKVSVDGTEGFFYAGQGAGSNVLAWFDEDVGIAFALQTNLDKETMCLIAENVNPVK